MKYNLEFSRRAKEDIKSLNKKDQIRIIEKLEILKKSPLPIDTNKIKKLKTFKNIYRLRAGDFRAIYSILNKLIVVLRIIDRKDLHKILKTINS